jgi:hypothetical protein
MLFGSMVFYTFENENVRIVPIDIRIEWIWLSAPAAFILPSATHIVGFRAARDMANMERNFTGHSQAKYWSTILNGLHEYRTIARQRGVFNPDKLALWAVWANGRLAGSAPMFGYMTQISLDVAGIVGNVLNIANFKTSAFLELLGGFLPDVILTEQATQPFPNEINLTSRIKSFCYHEFAHTSHYFKAGAAYWAMFVGHTVWSNVVGPIYGSDINSQPGRFCALPEAWAQYMAYQVGMQYYPTQNFSMPDPLLPPVVINATTGQLGTAWISRTLTQHAEINEMFYNDFIPCGLFYDLMDNDPNPLVPLAIEGGYDNISGYTTQQIFDLMQWDVQSMQEYRVRFERRYGSSPALTALFRRYNL